MDKIYVIYKDGKRLEKDQSGRTIKVAYLKKGSANGVITNLITTYLRWELNLSEVYERDKWNEEFNKEKARYEVIEYIPNVTK